MPSQVDLFTIRGAMEGDKNFIFATWLRGAYYDNTWFSQIPKDIFMQNYHKVIEHILGSPGVSVRVACLKDDPEVILGYSVSKDNHLDWIFVKKPWRGIGIGKSLTPTFTAVTHLTKTGSVLLKRFPGVVFNPFLI